LDYELEPVIDELLRLAKRKPLPKTDLEKAKQLMVKLRRMGFTSIEVAELTNGGWSEPTVKLYTRGAAVEDPSPKERSTKLLVELTERGLTLNEVEQAISITKILEAEGLTLDEVSSFQSEMKRLGVETGELVNLNEEVKASKLTITQLKEALAYKSELEKKGFSLETLGKLHEAAEAYGEPEEVLEALGTYGDLESLEAEASDLSSKKATLEKTASDLKLTVEGLEKQKEEIEEALRKHSELVDKGFTEEALDELVKTSDKYGGAKEVLKAINTYSGIKELEVQVSGLDKKKADIEAEIKSLNAQYAHLQTIIGICDNLLYKYKFSISAINDLYELAKRHGSPLEVLKILGRYGDLKGIEAEASRLSNRKVELEARIAELEKQLQELRGIADELKNSTKGLLTPLADEVNRGVNSIQQKFLDAINNISNSYEEYSKRLGELKADAGKLEEELRLARVVNTAIKYPSEAKDLPLDYTLLLHEAVAKLCKAKGVNPKVKAGEDIHSKYYGINSYAEVELLDIMGWARRGLLEATKAE